MTRRNYLINHNWFDFHFIGGFLYEANSVKKFLNEPKFTIGDETISSRVLKHWHDKGILSDNRPLSKGWRKFSISEIIWISIVLKLRSFGMELSKIKLVKDYIDSYNLKSNKNQSSLLDFYISLCIASEVPIKLLVFHDGDSLLCRQIDIDLASQHNSIQEDYISIDLNRLVQSRLKSKNINTDYIDYSLSNLEKEVRTGIYIQNIKSISIQVINDDDILITKEHIRNSKEEIKNLLINAGNYYEETSVRNGKGSYFKLKEKKKLKK